MSSPEINAGLLNKKLDRAEAKVKILEKMIEDKTRSLYIAKSKLSHANEYLRNIENSMAGALFVVEQDGTIRYANLVTLKVFGYEEAGIIGQPIGTLVGDKAFNWKQLTDDLLEDSQPSIIDLNCRTGNGKIFPAIFTASLMRHSDSDSADFEVVCQVVDVTERDADRRQLEMSEKKLRAILDATVDGILVADGSSHKFALGNPAICRMLGYRQEELAGLGVDDIHPPESLEYVRQQFARQLKGEIQVAEGLPVQRKDGTVFFADVSSSPVHADGREYLVGVFHDVSEQKAHQEKISKLNSLLLGIRRINEHLLVADSEKGLFQFVCDTLKALEHVRGVCIGLKKNDHAVDIVAYAGFDAATVAALDIRWDDSPRGQGTMGSAIRRRQPDVDDCLDKPRHGPWVETIERYGLKSAAAMPLIAEGEVLGAMTVYADTTDIFDDEIVRFLAEVAGDIALGVHTLLLNRKLKATLKSLRRSMDGTIEAVAGMVELRDPYTAGHEQRVGRLAEAIGKEMGLPERQVEGLRVTGYIHDIGKITVPAEILSKPTSLNEHEFALIREHARVGFDLLKNLDFPWPVADAVLQHHERLDGSGYPQGLKDEEIILEARILMVADVVESMAGHRPYRPAHGIEKALLEIITHKGKLYDAEVVDACVQLFTERKFSLQQEA